MHITDPRELATLRAALLYYLKGDQTNHWRRSQGVQSQATAGETIKPLMAGEAHALYQRLLLERPACPHCAGG